MYFNKGLLLLIYKERDKEFNRKMGKRQEQVICRRNKFVRKYMKMFDFFNKWRNEI